MAKEMLSTLRRIVQKVNQIDKLDDALDTLVAETKHAMTTDCCSVYLSDYDQRKFLLMATDGLAKSAVGQVSLDFTEGLVGLVGQREEPINIGNASAHPRFKYAPEVREESLNAFLGTPIIHQRRVLGVLVVQQSEARQFSADEEAFLVTLAAQLATVIAHAEARGMLAGPQAATSWLKCLHGVPGSPGVVIAPGLAITPLVSLDTVSVDAAEDPKLEIRHFLQALAKTKHELSEMSVQIGRDLSPDVKAIFDIYLHMLQDTSLGKAVEAEIEQGLSASSAIGRVFRRYIEQFESMSDAYLRERASDVRDLGERILGHLHTRHRSMRSLTSDVVLVAEEVTASMLAEVPREHLAGIVSMRGSNNSHAAILARAMGIPAILGVENVTVFDLENKELIVDGYSGELYVSPSEAIREEYLRLIGEEMELQTAYMKESDLAATTLDGQEIQLYLNAGLSADTESAQSTGADGVGLYRTEIPFLMRDQFPSEEEQSQLYRRILESYRGRPVTIRTLDVGGDKSLPYFPIVEDNPFLGWRGVRMTLDHPEIFLVQIRAMLRASIGLPNLRIMFPMITNVEEVEEALRLTWQAYQELQDELGDDRASLTRPKVGVMVEVPGIIYQLPALSKRIDFISVGTNDLTQYLLAVDRNNARVASLYDSFHPAVLQALKHVNDQAVALGLPVSVCGELAADPGGALLLSAMGYNQLSMNSQNIPRIKWVIRRVTFTQAREILSEVLKMDHSSEIRQHLALRLEELGLGGLVRAGK